MIKHKIMSCLALRLRLLPMPSLLSFFSPAFLRRTSSDPRNILSTSSENSFLVSKFLTILPLLLFSFPLTQKPTTPRPLPLNQYGRGGGVGEWWTEFLSERE